MKRIAAAALAAFLMMGSTLPVLAQQPPGQPPFGRPDRQDRDRDRERPPARDASWPGRGGHDAQQGGRMSPQEREQLRRDINSHGRDIYRQDRGRR